MPEVAVTAKRQANWRVFKEQLPFALISGVSAPTGLGIMGAALRLGADGLGVVGAGLCFFSIVAGACFFDGFRTRRNNEFLYILENKTDWHRARDLLTRAENTGFIRRA